MKSSFLLTVFTLCATLVFAQINSEINKEKSTIYFIRTKSAGKAINFKYFIDQKYVGKFKYGQYLKVEVDPGEHIIWAKSENSSYLEANLMAGKTYIVESVPKAGFAFARVSLKALPNDEVVNLKEALAYISEKEMITNNISDEDMESMEETVSEGLTKYNLDWKGKKEMDLLLTPIEQGLDQLSGITVQYQEIPKRKREPTQNIYYPLGPATIIFNPLGFIQFGPIIHVDIMVGQRLSIFPHLRFAGLGLAMHEISSFDQLSVGSFAIGAGIRGFLGKFNRSGKTYVGGIFELGWGKGKDNPETYNEKRYQFATFSIMPHAGYRWRFESGFVMNLGAILAIAYTYKDERVYPTYASYYEEVNVIPMIEFSIGWEFK